MEDTWVKEGRWVQDMPDAKIKAEKNVERNTNTNAQMEDTRMKERRRY